MWLGAMAVNARQGTKKSESKKSTTKEKNEPYNIKKDPFFRIARLIMSKEEIDIYKHLTNHASRLNFIDEFWKKRDPTPGTDENESKQEFLLRIAYANKWFRETPKGEGWNTERGRILLQLGFPDQRKISEGPPTFQGQLTSTRSYRREYWIYYRYQLTLYFDDRDSRDKFLMYQVPTNFAYALDRAKLSLNLAKSKKKSSFEFDANYKSKEIAVSIPVKKLSFEEKDNMMTVEFGVQVYVYKDNVKIDELNTSKIFSIEKEKLLNMKTIEFVVPYTATEKGKGKYYFDVVIEEKSSTEKFRDFIKFKI
jgi:GWxTD domain-containing protein